MKDSLLIQNKSKLDRQPEKISRRRKKTDISHQTFMNMLFVWIFVPEVLWMYTSNSTKNIWKSKILFYVCCTTTCFSVVIYTPKGVRTAKQKQKSMTNNQESGLCCDIVLLCFGLYKPNLAFHSNAGSLDSDF